MAMIGRLGTESVKGLGPGAYLVSVLPSTILVTSIYLIFTASLYPWTDPPKGTSRGLDSAMHVLAALGGTRTAVLVAVVLLLSVLIRPLHVVAVQLLEGYWGARSRYGSIEGLAIERQLRRYARARARKLWRPTAPGGSGPAEFASVVQFSRRHHTIERRKVRARQIVDSYPDSEALVLPTLLGNVLRRAETTAGERFGLDTVLSYPRLYPFLGQRIHDGLAIQFNLLDSAAAFTIVFWALSVFTIPTAFLGSWWFLVPVALLMAGTLAYAGAIATAREHGSLLSTAYDLYRFDMLAGLRLALPQSPEEERSTNEQLSKFLRFAEDFVRSPHPQLRKAIASSYEHQSQQEDYRVGPSEPKGRVGGDEAMTSEPEVSDRRSDEPGGEL